jgi:hypothetical protein
VSGANFIPFWSDETQYDINDVVTSANSNQYICIQAHVSSYTTTKPQTGTDWASFWRLYSYISCDSTTAINVSTYSRDTFDCGSYFDIGAVTDLPQDIFIEQHELIHDRLRCPSSDGTGFVVSEILDINFENVNSHILSSGEIEEFIPFEDAQPDENYTLSATLRNESGSGSNFDFIIVDKSTTGFRVAFSSAINRDDYYIDYNVTDTTNAGETFIPIGTNSVTVSVPSSCGPNYTVSATLKNTSDSTAIVFAWTIKNKTSTNFTVELSSAVPTASYSIEWFICEGELASNTAIPNGSNQLTVTLPSTVDHDTYPVLANIVTTDSTTVVYTKPLIIDKTTTTFTVQFDSSIIGNNYYLSWSVPTTRDPRVLTYDYYQTGGFRDFDSEGTFDCTHGFDHVVITVEDLTNYLLQETGDYLLLEDDFRILL